MSTATIIVLTLLKLASIWGLPAALWLVAVVWADRTPSYHQVKPGGVTWRNH